MKKILFGSASAILAVLGLSAFTAKPSKITAGWYLAPLNGSVVKNGTYIKSSFPVSFGTTPPASGFGQPCSTNSTVICAAYFNAAGVNVPDPSTMLSFVTGTHAN